MYCGKGDGRVGGLPLGLSELENPLDTRHKKIKASASYHRDTALASQKDECADIMIVIRKSRKINECGPQ